MDSTKGESSPNITSAGGLIELIMTSWKVLARHGDECEQCEKVVAELRKVPDDWLPFYDQCCKQGQEHFGVWALARQGMVEQFKDPATRRDGSLVSAANAAGNMMFDLQQRRKRLGMIGLSESEARVRALALDDLPSDAFEKLLAIKNDEARENEIQALVNAQRRKHVMVEIYPSGRNIVDNRIMYRWKCACGAEADGDSIDAETAKAYWGRHAGLLAEPASVGPSELIERACRWCHELFQVARDSKDRYCCREHAQEYFRAHRKDSHSLERIDTILPRVIDENVRGWRK